MNNILIITNTRDNLGSSVSFVKNINDIKDDNHREMIKCCINYDEFKEVDGLWVEDGMCGSNGGYIFNDYVLFDKNLPVTIEHIVHYVF